MNKKDLILTAKAVLSIYVFLLLLATSSLHYKLFDKMYSQGSSNTTFPIDSKNPPNTLKEFPLCAFLSILIFLTSATIFLSVLYPSSYFSIIVKSKYLQPHETYIHYSLAPPTNHL